MELPKDLKKFIDSTKTKEPLGFLGLFQLVDNSIASFAEKLEEGNATEFNHGASYLLVEVKKCNNSLYNELFFNDFEKNTRLLECTFSLCEVEFSSLTEFKSDKKNLANEVEDGLLESIPFIVAELSCMAISLFVLSFKKFLPNYEFKNSLASYIDYKQKKIDNRISQYAPTNNERLKALSIFCPELIKRLHNLTRKDKEIVLNLITGVNKDDAYKKVFTADKKILNETIIKNDEIDIEDLKNKLNKT
jgi:hypothetical protein